MKLLRWMNSGSTFLSLENNKGFKLVLSSLGAGIREVVYLGKKMTLSPDCDSVYQRDKSGFYGKTIGPVAGRLARGHFSPLPLFQLPENELSEVCLHSETLNYAFLNFDYLLEVQAGQMDVVFTRHVASSPGYPAEVDVEVRYRLFEDETRFELSLKATPSCRAPLHLTNHVYWALGEQSMKDAKVTILAEETVSYNDRLLPKKRIKAKGSLDYRKGKPLHEGADAFLGTALNGIDHAFYCKPNEVGMILENAGYRLEIATSGEGYQVYSLNYPNPKMVYSNGLAPAKNIAVTSEPILDPVAYKKDFLFDESKPFETITTFRFSKIEEGETNHD